MKNIIKRCYICNVVLANNDVFYCDVCDEVTKIKPLTHLIECMNKHIAEMKKWDSGHQKVMRVTLATQFAEEMHRLEKAYHWDDCATDIIGPPNGERIFSDEEAIAINTIVSELYCEELFEVSNRLLGNSEGE